MSPGPTSQIFSLSPTDVVDRIGVASVWTDAAAAMPAGATGMTTVQVGDRLVLVAYNKTTQTTSAYVLTGAAPWLQPVACAIDLKGGPWDSVSGFVFGNDPYLLTYRADTGAFGFF